MPKGFPKRGDEQMLEGGGAGAGAGLGGVRSSALNPRPTGSRSAKDYKEKERESELSGRLNFESSHGRAYDSGDRTPRMSDDYKKGGKVSGASKRADGIAQRGKTRGTIVMCGGGYMKGKK